jgi:hypothetical protein
MTDELEAMGTWWLPGQDKHKVPGRLIWNSDSGGELELLGQLRPDEWEDHKLPDGSVQRVRSKRADTTADLSYAVIHGQVGELRALTLMNCFSTWRQVSFGEDSFTQEKIDVPRVLESSAWFLDLDEVAFDRAAVDLRHLTGWINRSGITVSNPFLEGEPERFAVVEARRLDDIKVPCGDGIVSFVQMLSGDGDRLHSSGVEQRWQLRIAFSAQQSVDQLASIASDVQDLVSIAAGSTADFERVAFEHPDVPLGSLAGPGKRDLRDEVIYRARWSNRSKVLKTVRQNDFYFSFDDFGGSDGLQRWLNLVPSFRTELRRVMATRYNGEMFIEDRVMNTCAALDSFDKVRRNTGKDVNFVDRIKESVAFVGEPIRELLPSDTNAWADVVRDVRHDLAHHKDRFRNNKVQIDHLLSEQLFWLFVFGMLRLAETPQGTFESIARHRQIRWLAEQAGVATANQH